MNQKTPMYQPNFHEAISPRKMHQEPKKEAPKVDIPPPKPAFYEEIGRRNQAAYKDLSEDEKALFCAGIALSANWRKFLRPYLETFTNPVRRPVKSDEDYYTLLNDNAVAAFAEGLINHVESKARRSPSYNHMTEEE